jgi:hypothetical protein
MAERRPNEWRGFLWGAGGRSWRNDESDRDRLAAAIEAIHRLRDETDPVIAAAERLVQGALGDGHLWAAVGPLRDALDGVPSRLNPDTGELWRPSRARR